MSNPAWSVALALILCLGSTVHAQTRLRIAAVDNPDILLLRDVLTPARQQHLNVVLDWTLYPEDVLRKQTALDFRTGKNHYDVVMIGSYDTPIAAAHEWLTPLPERRPSTDYLATVVDSLSYDGQVFALPFYGESSITFYRADWLASAGLTMPEQPSWADIERIAAALHRPQDQRYGVCLRGEPGWGINMALLNTMGNAHGARWFDEAWQPQFNQLEWQNALNQYVRLVGNYGPPDPQTLGFNRLLNLFRNGQCAIWVDATVAASILHSSVSDLAFVEAPHAVTQHGKQWLWSWAFGVPATSPEPQAAWRFIRWITSAEYHIVVEHERGIDRVPPGTLHSLYERADYHAVAPFAQATFAALQRADPTRPTLDPVPYTGIQYVGIAEFSFIAEQFGKKALAAVQGEITVTQALDDVQQLAEAFMAIQRRNR